jgi:Phage portal protein
LPVTKRLAEAWNAFWSRDVPDDYGNHGQTGPSVSYSPSRGRSRYYNDRSIVTAIYNRIAIDVAGIGIRHVRVDDNDRYISNVTSTLNDCLTLEPNIDQNPRDFRQDICQTLFDSGYAAIVPVDTVSDPTKSNTFQVLTLRVGEITAWYPKHVKVNLYNEATGNREEVILEKRMVAIVVNPLYNVMNAPSSTLQRLIRKLQLLDVIDEQSGSGKLDIIIQLPYVIKSEARREQAEKRREDIEWQLKGSQYGIAYTDGTEKITQLNRPADNNLMASVERLTKMLYSELGTTEDVMNGTADEATMLNYFNRTVEPILDAIIESMQRALLNNAGAQSTERVRYFRDPFKLVPVAQLAEIVDKFTRNEILTSNEIRAIIGFAPSSDPKADKLINSNMPQPQLTTGT